MPPDSDPRDAIAAFVARAFPRPRHALEVQSSEAFLASGDPRALDYHRRGLLLPYIAFSFEPHSFDVAHVGCILTAPGQITVGLHLARAGIERHRAGLEMFAAATGFALAPAPGVEELQCNAPPLALSGGGVAEAAARAALYCAWLAAMFGQA